MSNMANNRYDQLTREIGQVQERLDKNFFEITKLTKKKPKDDEDKELLTMLKGQKKELDDEKKRLQKERASLQRETEWTYTELVKWTNSYNLQIGEKCSKKTNNVSEENEANMNNLGINEWSRFNTHFNKFKKLTELKFEKTKFAPVSQLELDLDKEAFREIKGHDHLHRNIMDILEASLTKRIFHVDKDLEKYSSGRFESRPNSCPTHSDIYLTAGSKEFLIAEVKTDKQLYFVSNTSLNSKINDKKSDIYTAIAQIATDLIFSNHNPKVAVLTTYTKSWVVQIYPRSANNISMLISPMITNVNFFQVIYFVCSLLFEEIRNSIDGWSYYVTNDMVEDQTANNKLLKRPGPSNGSNNHSNNQSSKKQRPNNSNDSQPSKKTQQSTTVEADLNISDDSGVDDVIWQDLLFDSISKWKVIGYGLCGVVCRASIREHEYVIKKCSLTKSPKFALDELKNEHSILLQLKKIKEVADFVPSTYYYGSIFLQQLLVCDFIDGRVYNSFNEMDQRTKLACLARVKRLHASNVLHGDLRAPNFIVQPDKKVFVIDFGRSEILEENASIQAKEEFKKSLVTEMKTLKSQLK